MKTLKTWTKEITIDEAIKKYNEENLVLSHTAFANYYVALGTSQYFEYEGKLGSGIIVAEHDFTHHAAIITYYLRRN